MTIFINIYTQTCRPCKNKLKIVSGSKELSGSYETVLCSCVMNWILGWVGRHKNKGKNVYQKTQGQTLLLTINLLGSSNDDTTQRTKGFASNPKGEAIGLMVYKRLL